MNRSGCRTDTNPGIRTDKDTKLNSGTQLEAPAEFATDLKFARGNRRVTTLPSYHRSVILTDVSELGVVTQLYHLEAPLGRC